MSATLPSVPRDPLNCLTMILESRDTISYALAAYSDFMASLDPARHKQEKALFVQLSFTKIYTYLRVRLLHHNLSSPLHRRRQPVSLHHHRHEIRIFQTIRGRNFPSAKNNFQTKLTSHQVQVTATTFKVGKTPPRKYCTRTRIGKGKSELLRPHQYTLTLLMTPLCA